jgi:hypothetical protein
VPIHPGLVPLFVAYGGCALRQIQELLGHKHLDSTQRYTPVHAHQLHGAIKRLVWVEPKIRAAQSSPSPVSWLLSRRTLRSRRSSDWPGVCLERPFAKTSSGKQNVSRDALAAAFERADVVIHLAWLIQPSRDERSPAT